MSLFALITCSDVSRCSRPIKERRRFLHENMVEIPNRILFSEMQHITVSDSTRKRMSYFRNTDAGFPTVWGSLFTYTVFDLISEHTLISEHPPFCAGEDYCQST